MAVRQMLVAGRYRLLEPVGAGGMGRVWLAHDEELDREIAIKELVPPDWMTGAEQARLRERTRREARSAARLSHPHLVRVYDIVHAQDLSWIVMEYIPSRSLNEVLAEDGPYDPVGAAAVGLAVLDGLDAAHRAGVLHRDVKPHNVLIGADGRVVLTDFGLATFVDDGAITTPGLIVGSPQYVSPERARDGASTVESDLWSFGATLYAAVEGRSPYARETAMATLGALATEPPDPPVQAGPLGPVLAGLLRYDPATRLTAAEVAHHLRAIISADQREAPFVPGQRAARRPSPTGQQKSSAEAVERGAAEAPLAPAEVRKPPAGERKSPAEERKFPAEVGKAAGEAGERGAGQPPSVPAAFVAPANSDTSEGLVGSRGPAEAEASSGSGSSAESGGRTVPRAGRFRELPAVPEVPAGDPPGSVGHGSADPAANSLAAAAATTTRHAASPEAADEGLESSLHGSHATTPTSDDTALSEPASRPVLESTSGPRPASRTKSGAESASRTEPGVEPGSRTKSGAESASRVESGTESASRTEPGVEPGSRTESGTEVASRIESATEPVPRIESGTQPGTAIELSGVLNATTGHGPLDAPADPSSSRVPATFSTVPAAERRPDPFADQFAAMEGTDNPAGPVPAGPVPAGSEGSAGPRDEARQAVGMAWIPGFDQATEAEPTRSRPHRTPAVAGRAGTKPSPRRANQALLRSAAAWRGTDSAPHDGNPDLASATKVRIAAGIVLLVLLGTGLLAGYLVQDQRPAVRVVLPSAYSDLASHPPNISVRPSAATSPPAPTTTVSLSERLPVATSAPAPGRSASPRSTALAAAAGGFSPLVCDEPSPPGLPVTPKNGAARGVNGWTLPAGWSYFTDGSGFHIAVPDGWTYQRIRTTYCFREPQGPRVLSLDLGRDPAADPLKACRAEDRRLRKKGGPSGYTLVAIEAAPLINKAADWEHRYRDAGGALRHVSTRWLVVGGKAYALGWATAETAWAEDRNSLLMIRGTFYAKRSGKGVANDAQKG